MFENYNYLCKNKGSYFFMEGFDLKKAINVDELRYDWDYILSYPFFKVLKLYQQNPRWHSEGDCWEHTKLVCEEMCNIIKERWGNGNFRITLNKNNVWVLMVSALLHDIGKTVTTTCKNGVYHAYNHEIEGEKIARLFLWEQNTPLNDRELICSLVRWHMEPLKIFEGSAKDYLTKICRLSKRTQINLLVMLKEADLRGSIQEDKEGKKKDFEKLQMLESVARRLGCLTSPSMLETQGKFSWMRNKDNKKVIVMIGLPGAGKDTLINEELENNACLAFNELNKENTIIVCRDDIRIQLGYCKEGEKIIGTKDEENRVTEVFNEALINAAKEGKNIIINNINLKALYRQSYKDTLKAFNYDFDYVYVEADSLNKNIERRKGQISPLIFASQIGKMDWPDFTEYNKFYKIIN